MADIEKMKDDIIYQLIDCGEVLASLGNDAPEWVAATRARVAELKEQLKALEALES